MDNCVDKSKKKGKTFKIDFKKKKKQTIKSLQEVENFLGNLKKTWKYVNLYNILKK